MVSYYPAYVFLQRQADSDPPEAYVLPLRLALPVSVKKIFLRKATHVEA